MSDVIAWMCLIAGVVLSGGIAQWILKVAPRKLLYVLAVLIPAVVMRGAVVASHDSLAALAVAIGTLMFYGVVYASYRLWPKTSPVVLYPWLVIRGLVITMKRKTDALVGVAKSNR